MRKLYLPICILIPCVRATRLEIISRTIESTERGDSDGALAIVNEGQGKAAMDRVRAVAAEMQAEEPRITDGIFGVLTAAASVASRTSFGGTAPDNVRRMAAEWRERLA